MRFLFGLIVSLQLFQTGCSFLLNPPPECQVDADCAVGSVCTNGSCEAPEIEPEPVSAEDAGQPGATVTDAGTAEPPTAADAGTPEGEPILDAGSTNENQVGDDAGQGAPAADAGTSLEPAPAFDAGPSCAEGQVPDCTGECGGDAVEDCLGVCNGTAEVDCAGTCGGAAEIDCAGTCGGQATVDCLGVCGGFAVTDCAGACNGGAVVDCTGTCGGDARIDCLGVCQGAAVIDCAGTCEGSATSDCAGVCNGDAVTDCAGTCNGTAEVDCAGTCNGFAKTDCAGICEGTAIVDCAGTCDGAATEDCLGTCNGTAEVDCAGTCNGTAELDCAGTCNGTAELDCAGTCNGTAELDCAGTCNGTAELDCAGVCNGTAELDCAGTCNGDAQLDCAGTCNGTAEVDCAGACGGQATVDCLGVCGGFAVTDCAGACNGGAVVDCTGTCGGAAERDCTGTCNGTAIADCSGVCNGTAQVDCAGECKGDAELDCAGTCNGNAIEDCNGVCEGGAIVDCNGVCGGGLELDCAGVCGGDLVSDCSGVCGGTAQEDCAGVCKGTAEEDCAGTCNGTAEVDCAGTCNGDATADCFGTCEGEAYTDSCGHCVGGASGVVDCDNAPDCAAGQQWVQTDGEAVCETCPFGTTDDDSDPDTPCVACTVCGRDEITTGLCSPTTDIECVVCGTNPAGYETPTGLSDEVDFNDCPEHDPECDRNIDVLVFYTPSYFEVFQGDLDAINDVVNYVLFLANQSLENSFVPPDRRYRLLGVEEFPYVERGHQKSDLQWLRMNPYYQSRRRATGADVGIFFTGGPNANALAYSNTGTVGYEDRGITILGGSAYHPDTSVCGVAQLTPAHELGHILGAGHKMSQFTTTTQLTSNGFTFGYHNQELHLRRNWAYGLPVSQHELKVYTLMSYGSYDKPNNAISGCLDCTQLPVFSSPDIWWFFDPTDPQFGYCKVLNDQDTEAIELHCQNPTPWVATSYGYAPHPDSLLTVSAEQLLDRSIPMGVVEPSYTDENGVTTNYNFSTDNTSRINSHFPYKANNSPVLAPTGACDHDCASTGHVHCGITAVNVCLDHCLPGHTPVGDDCLPRIESNSTDPLHDEYYEPVGTSAVPGQTEGYTINLLPNSNVHHVELFLATVDENGEQDYSWIGSLGGTIWVLSEPPAHGIEVFAHRANGSVELVGKYPHDPQTESALALTELQDSSGQKNHALSYSKTFEDTLADVHQLEVRLTAGGPDGDGEYGFTLLETRTFGTAD